MKVIQRVFVIFVFLVALSQGGAFAQVTEKKIVRAIRIEGNKMISVATILSRIKTRVGQSYLQTVISDDLKRLYNTGYFSDVRVDHEDFDDGFRVIIYIDEKPIIEEITFSKTKRIRSRVIEKKLNLQVGKFFDNKMLKDDKKIIKEMFAKKGMSFVEIDVEEFLDEITNKVSLHLIIREGFQVRINEINIYGNIAIRDGKIKRLLKSKSSGLFRGGHLKEKLLDADVDRITTFYEKKGFIDIRVAYEVEYLQKGVVDVNISIEEGIRYTVGDVILYGNNIISDKEIGRIMRRIEEDGIFSREKLKMDIADIRTLYFDRGYIFAKVDDSTSLDGNEGRIDVKIDIEEGGLAYINKVQIQGNIRTQDIVIRRELRLYPGDRFDGSKLRRSKERLSNLGYFEDISFDIGDTSTYDRKNLLVQVKEGNTGNFSFGGGFSTVDRVVGFVEIEQRNFDVANWPTFVGAGQNLKLRAETGSSKNNVVFSFTEPWVFDRPISFGFDLYSRSRDRGSDTGYAYDETRTGGSVRLSKQFGEYTRSGISYKLEEIDILNFGVGVSSAIRAEEGKNTVSILGFNYSYDRRDNIFSPRKGYFLSTGINLAGGILGGDKNFFRANVRGNYLYSV